MKKDKPEELPGKFSLLDPESLVVIVRERQLAMSFARLLNQINKIQKADLPVHLSSFTVNPYNLLLTLLKSPLHAHSDSLPYRSKHLKFIF